MMLSAAYAIRCIFCASEKLDKEDFLRKYYYFLYYENIIFCIRFIGS